MSLKPSIFLIGCSSFRVASSNMNSLLVILINLISSLIALSLSPKPTIRAWLHFHIYALRPGPIWHVGDIHSTILSTSFQEDVSTSTRFDITKTANGTLLQVVVDSWCCMPLAAPCCSVWCYLKRALGGEHRHSPLFIISGASQAVSSSPVYSYARWNLSLLGWIRRTMKWWLHQLRQDCYASDLEFTKAHRPGSSPNCSILPTSLRLALLNGLCRPTGSVQHFGYRTT